MSAPPETSHGTPSPAEVTRTELITREPAESLAAVLDITSPTDSAASLPPLWHWVYLMERPAQRDLGPDGHPVAGIPAPPGLGRRRMFAGGRVTTHTPLCIGEPATRTTQVAEAVEKQGRSGPLTFITVRDEISQHDVLVIVEERDIVYRAPGAGSLPVPNTETMPTREPSLSLTVDETLLFRFSALTYNAHRIHYDQQWARHEGYDDLVVHGPLQALMMGELMRHNNVDLVGRQYSYRLISPMVGPQTFTALASEDGLTTGAEIHDAHGHLTASSQHEKTA